MARVLVAADRYDRDLCRPNGGLDVPGKPVTDQQVRAYMQDRLRHSQHAAAARAGFSARTARRIENDPRLPSQRRAERGRTVPDPLGEVWEPVLLPILENDPAVQAVTLLRHLQMADPDAFPDDRVRRTLERRVRDWRALHGAARDVIFRQTPEPGRMALSDFTDAAELAITIAGRPFAHRLYHFVLGYSGWEHVGIIQGGESFTALAENLQNALWSLGGVPREHRTDSLSAAYRNLDREAAEDVTQRYDDFCGHYGMVASRNNPGEAHENGTVEAHNRHLKVALDQALILRGSRDFASVADWRGFVDQLVARRNRRREAAVRIEAAAAAAGPAHHRLHRGRRPRHAHRRLLGSQRLLQRAVATDRAAPARPCLRRPHRSLARRDPRRQPSPPARAGRRSARPPHRLSPCRPCLAPQATGAGRISLPRQPLSSERVRCHLGSVVRGAPQARRLPAHGRPPLARP
jgi:hypothetical protein